MMTGNCDKLPRECARERVLAENNERLEEKRFSN
jgi:hypothetical protein